MFKILVFMCSLNITPANCTEKNASQVLESPTFTNPFECNQSQSWLAKLAIQPIPGKEYIKTSCIRMN